MVFFDLINKKKTARIEVEDRKTEEELILGKLADNGNHTYWKFNQTYGEIIMKAIV